MQWCVMVCNGMYWYVMVCNGMQWFVMVQNTHSLRNTHYTPGAPKYTCHARHCKRYSPQRLDCKLYTSHCKLHTSHWARNAQRCISHSTDWTLQVKTIHCKHYSPRHAHSTHQSPHSALQMQTRHSTCLPPHATQLFRQPTQSTHFRITHIQRTSARWRKVPNKYG